MKCLSIESRIITCSSVSVDSLLLALSRIRRCESLFALLFVMESKYSAGLCFYRVAVVSLQVQSKVQSLLLLPSTG